MPTSPLRGCLFLKQQPDSAGLAQSPQGPLFNLLCALARKAQHHTRFRQSMSYAILKTETQS
jgi:hypothetical protein